MKTLNDDNENTVCVCELDDGVRMRYDMADPSPIPYSDNFILLGHGVIHSVDGIVQDRKYSTPLYFFKYKKVSDEQ